MDDFELLQQLFGDKLIQAEEGGYGRPQLILQEEDYYSICIRNVPENVVAIKTDSFPDLRHFFHCSSNVGQCKRADFVVISNDKKLIFIELSTTKKQTKEVEQQLQGAQCVIEYCRSIGEKFYQCDSFLKGYNPYFVSIYNIGVDKKTSTNTLNEGNNNSPNNFLKINAPNNIQFKQLCHKR